MAGDTFTENGVDRSIGLLLLGLGVAAFIALTVVGMGSLQTNAKKAMGPAPVVEQPATDFSE